MRLIFFGGCFDPPHKGHVEIIRKCANHCNQFILMPTLHSPLKSKDSSTDLHHILQMLKLIIQDLDKSIVIDKYDLSRSGPSYTVDTIRYLQEKYPEHSISMVVGEDQLIKFKQWRDYLDIINLVHIIGFNRSKCNFTPLPNMNITWIEDFQMNISSELIRKDIAKGKLNKDDLTPYIKNYIIKNKLYGY